MKKCVGAFCVAMIFVLSVFADGRFKFIEGKFDNPRIKLDTYSGKAWRIEDESANAKTSEIKFTKPATTYKKSTYSVSRKYSKVIDTGTNSDYVDEVTLMDEETGKTWEMRFLDHQNPSWVPSDEIK